MSDFDESNEIKKNKLIKLQLKKIGQCIFSADELPRYTERVSETGMKIKFHEKELIEDGSKSENIEISRILGTCMVCKAHEYDSLDDILQENNTFPMAYVCRYKLVKETIYKLVPVSWQPGEEENEFGHHMGNMTDMEYTDSEDQASEPITSLSESIDKLCEEMDISSVSKPKDSHKSIDKLNICSPLVSPIKIVNNTVQKAIRTRNHQTSPNKRASSDAGKDNADVSPSKRNKKINKANNETTSDKQKRLYESPAQNKMLKAKKNLNNSFTEASNEPPSSPYESKLNPQQPLKITLSKGNKKVLTEKNENTICQSPLNRTVMELRDGGNRRSILKTQDSPRSEYWLFFLFFSFFFLIFFIIEVNSHSII